MSSQIQDWVKGDHLGLMIPTHVQALHEGAEPFLTLAFQASGILAADNYVTTIRQLQSCPGGSTGRKYLLGVEYARSEPQLQSELFIKLSRDFDDPIRDQAKMQLEPEVGLALLSRQADFPIQVPHCYFADYHHESGSGILITQRIPFGEQGLEPLYAKCLDFRMPEPLQHYEAIITCLAQLAGTHKAGKLGYSVEQHFPFEAHRQSLHQPIRYSLEQLQRRIEKYSRFVAQHPRLMPADISTPAFIQQLQTELPLMLAQEENIKHYLHSQPAYIALIHWNANVDNAWFWRDEAGQLHCGLLDWGGVSQMNIGLALWGALSAAETSLWRDHLDALLALFIAEFRRAGGPALSQHELQRQLVYACIMMSLSWLMDAPAMISRAVPNLQQDADRFDPTLNASETARTQLIMLSNFLSLWQRFDAGRLLREDSQGRFSSGNDPH